MRNKGFIQIIIIGALLVIILSLLGVSLSSLFSNPILKENFGFLGKWLAKLWNSYLSAPFQYLWSIWVDLIWEPFLDILKGLIKKR
ncbi:hypothetical protein A3G55_03230 [Candidatus Giovannonibacteria bacterium RIFCSPLOWO2_12_FULL_44_25]|uniref:Uncharacterized protein n=1 Tax=Candidatus Giovannonibacteria bacterium RIFCSPHIGHO2_02_FULL_45_40 TaxID=1798337 RepID=A0A1F5W7R7_9BACT|nr:MAG: hypothetical protein A2120_00300 [Candidatus Giovannonibacteria bacterium GWA2_45_15]OGF59446.1 MAG: hypothetical protein A2W40_03415 [Candidatus Giovannonibacteria bacterium RIFCSPHIGHO2_01_45_12]OGF61240.1 MAG: hypothetical protein A2656_04665 [Candidatus Giovannonibacteria bacterium RIFCSPHIGHO2_01_FULL_44_100]OGF71600.1 MAG: hypothetical protein A3C05_01185 [Candidatus Giovannonibacteria bacterium RIFCSPHIGHO2_02_FULL_45_40]OGF83575.1 MAG: hypothetical protein A3E63_03355 [Candidatu